MKTLKYFHLVLGVAGLFVTTFNMAKSGEITENISNLLSSIFIIVIAFRIKTIFCIFSMLLKK